MLLSEEIHNNLEFTNGKTFTVLVQNKPVISACLLSYTPSPTPATLLNDRPLLRLKKRKPVFFLTVGFLSYCLSISFVIDTSLGQYMIE